MKYKPAINVLHKRIEILQKEILQCEKIMAEPELLSDYEFAKNDAGNFENEVINLTEAIDVLRKL